MEAIKCEGLTKRYSNIVALDSLDLSIKEQSIFGFLGPNGAGKTTTIKLLVGLSNPTAGRALVAGQEVTPEAIGLRSKVGYLPEVPAFYNWMNGPEFLSLVGELHHLSKAEIKSRSDELLELVALEGVTKRRIGGYSRGMRQRLGIAQALMNKPEVIFLDEPCSALDPIGRKEVLELVKRLSAGATVFMSTHILSDVERVCDSVGIINQGKLVMTSSLEELQHKYPRSVFELEFEQDVSPLVGKLQAVPWMDKVEQIEVGGSPALRIQIMDINIAKRELPAIVAASGLTLLRYELTLPSLEDIFIELVDSGGRK